MAKMRQLKIADRLTQRTANINRYFNELNLEDTLSAEQEFEVATKAAAGDERAIEKLVKANLRFVVSVAKQYASSGELLSELIAQGNMGLMESARKFDPSRGFKFISFAVWYIRKDIIQYFHNFTKTVRTPTNINLLKNKFKDASAILATRLGREATEDEVLDEIRKTFDVTKNSYDRMLNSINNYSVHLESNSSEDEWSPIDYLESDISPAILDKDIHKLFTRAMLKCLIGKEKFIITKFFGLDGDPEWSTERLAKHFDVTGQTISNNKKLALRRMRSRLNRTGTGSKIKRELYAELA